MFRQVTGCLLVGMCAFAAGCKDSSQTDHQVYVARANLMPTALPTRAPEYTRNQSTVKLAPERTIDYKPLEAFRPARADDTESGARAAEAKAPAAPLAGGKPTGALGQLKQGLLSLFKGGRKGPPIAKAANAAEGDEDDSADADDSEDDEDDSADADDSEDDENDSADADDDEDEDDSADDDDGDDDDDDEDEDDD